MRVVFFGTYNRGHTANRIAMAAVRAAGFEITEIHESLWERTRDKDATYFGPRSLARLALRWIGAAWRLAGQWRRSGGGPVAIAGFNGQLDVLLLRMLSLRHGPRALGYGPRIVFAPLVSLTETLVDDRGVYAPGSIGARLLRGLDRATCRAADVTVVDTEEHRRYFSDELGVERSRLLVCHLGADPDTFLRRPIVPAARRGADRSELLEVLYFGQYLPLHGLDVIVDAIGRLAVRDDTRGRLRFTFIGSGEERARVEPVLRATRAELRFIDWIPYDELAARIAAADIVLGIFGSSRKARMVIPNKVYEAAAVGTAIVTADTPAIREVFEDGSDIVLCRADGLALADAIARMASADDGAALRERIGQAARERMETFFSAAALGRQWSVAIAGADALRPGDDPVRARRIGVAILCFQDARRTIECLHSLAGEGSPNLDVLVIDNGSVEAVRHELTAAIEGRLDVELLLLERNLGYAGANNVALERLFACGCDAVLLLNSDTLVAPGSIAALAEASRSQGRAGPLGPRVAQGRPGQRAVSLGERYRAAFLWVPRTLLRVRVQRQRPYPVSGVTGCAFFVPRALWQAVGGFDVKLFAYYEEVDYCLRAREAGFVPTLVPGAEVGHAGARGFAGGMTPLAAWLKARNLRIVGLRRLRGLSRVLFMVGYRLLLLASDILYRLRGRSDVARALMAGARAAGDGLEGPPPEELFAASGYPSSGLAAGLAAGHAGDDADSVVAPAQASPS